MQASFTGKKVLVTGAGRGIGRHLAKTLAEDGAVVYALSKNPNNLKSLQEECPNIKTIVCDLRDWAATEKALSDLEVLDHLVNNAGVAIKEKFSECTEEVFNTQFDINLKAAMHVTKGAFRPGPDIMAYNCSKASMEMLTKCMAKELAPHGIRVNNVNPTVVMTDMGVDLWEDIAEDFRKTLPLQQFPTTKHCTNAILFLLSDLSEMTTGAYFPVDSGELLK